MVFQVGKATKRSRLGTNVSDQITEMQRVTEFCVKAGLDFHLIDAEWKENYMDPSELERVLTFTEEDHNDLTTIVTVNARHSTAFELVSEYLEVMSQHDNSGFCFVTGNPAYLSEEERKLDAKSRTRLLLAETRSRLSSAPIFIGSEGQRELTMELADKEGAIPFMLLNNSLQDQASRLSANDNGVGLGVYSPCLLSGTAESDLIRTLGTYALRRKWVRRALIKAGVDLPQVTAEIGNGGVRENSAVRILVDAIQSLALCGDVDVQDTFSKFHSMGIRYLALLPALEGQVENQCLSEIAAEMNRSE